MTYSVYSVLNYTIVTIYVLNIEYMLTEQVVTIYPVHVLIRWILCQYVCVYILDDRASSYNTSSTCKYINVHVCVCFFFFV